MAYRLIILGLPVVFGQYAQTATDSLYVPYFGAPSETVHSVSPAAQPTLFYNCNVMPATCSNIQDYLTTHNLELPLELTYDPTSRSKRRQSEQCSVERFKKILPCSTPKHIWSNNELWSPNTVSFLGKWTNVIDARYDNATGRPSEASGLKYTCSAFPPVEVIEGGLGENFQNPGSITCAPEAIEPRSGVHGKLSGEFVAQHVIGQASEQDWHANGMVDLKRSLEKVYGHGLGRFQFKTVDFAPHISRVWVSTPTPVIARRSSNASISAQTSIPTTSISTNKTTFDINQARSIIERVQAEQGAKNQWLYANPRFNARELYEGPDSDSQLKKRELEEDRPGTGVNDTIANLAALLTEAESGPLDHHDVVELAEAVQNATTANATHLAKRASSYWMENISHGHAQMSFNPDKTYKVWRNVVTDFGAAGDGNRDDTAAINAAIKAGNRCGQGCNSSTITGAVVYLPAGTYIVSSPIITYYYTQLIGDPTGQTIIKASKYFTGLGVISSDVYIPGGGGSSWYVNQNNFYRQIRNLQIDTTLVPEIVGPAAIHWQVAQATSLQNLVIKMPAGSTNHTGIYMENGSGGFFSDIVITGGFVGMFVGNQQFTTRNLHFTGCKKAIRVHWNWGWTWKSLNIRNADVGVEILPDPGPDGVTPGEANAGSVLIMDSTFSAVTTAVSIGGNEGARQPTIDLENLTLNQVGTVIAVGGTTILGGGLSRVDSFGYGWVVNDYGKGKMVEWSNLPTIYVPPSLKGTQGYFERSKPQYETLPSTSFLNVMDNGVMGASGSSDDTKAINAALQLAIANVQKVTNNQVAFFPAGTYYVQDTVEVPVGSRIVGQAWSQIMAVGAGFSDLLNPKVMVNVGREGDSGVMEISDMLFTTARNTAGAVLMQWNIHESTQGSSGMWDAHFRIGGALGTTMQKTQCPKLTGQVNPACAGASMLLHMTPMSSGYFENVWAWTADHDLDDNPQTQIDIYVARGILIESQGPTWLYGTASEHNTLYQYQLIGAQNIFMGMIQTESPYYQGFPAAPTPFQFSLGQFPGDPFFLQCRKSGADAKTCAYSWGLRIVRSTKIYVYGTGLYSWFQQYDQTCVHGTNDQGDGAPENCQQSIFNVLHSTQIFIHNLMTKGVVEMASPWSGATILSALHHNTYVSTLLAWFRDGNSANGGTGSEPNGTPGETITLPTWVLSKTTDPVSCIYPCVVQYPTLVIPITVQPPAVTVTVAVTELYTITPPLIANPTFSFKPITIPTSFPDPGSLQPEIIPVVTYPPTTINGHTIILPPLNFPISDTRSGCGDPCNFPPTPLPIWTLGNGPAYSSNAPDPDPPTGTTSSGAAAVLILPTQNSCVGSGCAGATCVGPSCNICNGKSCPTVISTPGKNPSCRIGLFCPGCIGLACQGCWGLFCPPGSNNQGSDSDDSPNPIPGPPPPDDNPNPPKQTVGPGPEPEDPDEDDDDEEDEEDEEQCTVPGSVPTSLLPNTPNGATYSPLPAINTGTATVDGVPQMVTPNPDKPSLPLDPNPDHSTVDCWTGGNPGTTANREQMIFAIVDACKAAEKHGIFNGDPDKQSVAVELPENGDLVIDFAIKITNYKCSFSLITPSGSQPGDSNTVCGALFRKAVDGCDTNGENSKHGGTVHTNCADFVLEANPYK